VLILKIILAILTAYLSFTVLYNYLLALTYLFIQEEKITKKSDLNKFCILIPAHNEELLLGGLLESLHSIDYPNDKYEITVIADNCNDDTLKIAEEHRVKCLVRINNELIGKGFALSWALNKIELKCFDGIFIIDADNYVDKNLLSELNWSLNSGAKVIQCNNSIGNHDASWLTRIHHVIRYIDNTFVHYAKHKLGLSSFLMGNGMCFAKEIIKKYPWKAFSLSEDFEYYSKLVLDGVLIDFNYQAKVFHQESTSLNQAYSQRSRWSAGKFEIIKKYAFPILFAGIANCSVKIIEASFILLLPHTSMLFNLSIFMCIISYFISSTFFSFAIVLIIIQILYFIIGMYLSKASYKTLISILYAPVYLSWKVIIDLKSLFGIGKRGWKRTRRL
jgi:cellulose synthase/poly-beta-1,6-N-acetylglucosamine synthase-like glycosyltransferase